MAAMQRAAKAAEKMYGRPAVLLLVVLPDTGAGLYAEVKQAGDSALGIPSQVRAALRAPPPATSRNSCPTLSHGAACTCLQTSEPNHELGILSITNR